MKEILESSIDARASLMRRRFSSRSLIGICRCVVAVGTARLASMFSAMRAGAPRSGRRSPTSAGPTGGADGAAGAGRAAGADAATATGSPGSPKRSRK